MREDDGVPGVAGGEKGCFTPGGGAWRATGFYNFELIACHRPRDISFSAALTTVGTTWEPPPPTTTSRHRSLSVRSIAHLYVSVVHSTRTRAINIYYNDVLYGGAHVCKRFFTRRHRRRRRRRSAPQIVKSQVFPDEWCKRFPPIYSDREFDLPYNKQ